MTLVSTFKGSFAPGLFAGSQVLVTGGTSGIGLACARAFRDHGASVLATGATNGECETATADPDNRELRFAALDVRNGAAIDVLVDGLDHLHVLVNCAGIIRRDDEHDPDIFADVVSINLTGTMRMCSAALPKLEQTGGCVVNTASMLTYFGGPRVPAYSASKGGIGQLTKSLAAAWAPRHVRVNALAPGWIATPLTSALRTNETASAPIMARTPMKRWGEPVEVADAALFLASPAAAFITGTILTVDGGYSAV